MNKKITVLVIGILLMSLFLMAGCGEEKKQVTAKKTATEKEDVVEDTEVETKEVAPEKSGGEYELEFCNKMVSDLRSDLQNAEDNLAETEQELSDLKLELSSAEADDKDALGYAVDNKEASIEAFGKSVANLKSAISEMEDKCGSYESYCDEFKEIARDEFDETTSEFQKEQIELQYTPADRIDIQKRKIALWKIRVENWSSILDDLNAKC